MISAAKFADYALSLKDVEEAPHFERRAFKHRRKIFATIDVKAAKASIRLSEADQSVYSLIDKEIIYPVDNKWGKQGWTIIDLARVPATLAREALRSAWTYLDTR